MSEIVTKPMTAADYRETPEGPPWWQLVEGELVQDPSPNPSHQVVAGNLFALLFAYVREHKNGKVYIAPLDVWIDDENVFQPDVFFVSARRGQLLAIDGIHGAPDFVVEILSPSSFRRDLQQKRAIYRRAGAQEYWVIDPVRRSISIFLASGEQTVTEMPGSPDQVVTSDQFPGLAIPLAEVFWGLQMAPAPT